MQFIADSMLGRLARWLRLLGYDTLYFSGIEDSLLLKIARQQNRILLTRDTRLVRVRGVSRFLLLYENDTFEQLRKVVRSFHLPLPSLDGPLKLELQSRCVLCNAALKKSDRESNRDDVPPYVYQTSTVFKKCSGCGKPYWDGTHPEKIRLKLRSIFAGYSPDAP